MKYLQKNILAVLLTAAVLLTGCTTLELRMRVDPSLRDNANVYKVTSPDSWSPDKRLNVSFGPYRVTDLDVGWTTTRTPSKTKGLLAILLQRAGISIGLSTDNDDDDYGYDDDTVSDPNTTSTEITESLTYAFTVNDKITWRAECHHLTEKDTFEKGNLRSVKILSSKYYCQYTRPGATPWVLSIDRDRYSDELDIKMIGQREVFKANPSRGYYVTSSDGMTYKTFRPRDPGYTWTDAGDNNLAAVAIDIEVPKVWLGKDNPDSTPYAINDILSMATTGLLIYKWKIEPGLK